MTLTDRLERFFVENSAVFVDGKDLAGVAGTYAWRTRLSEVRQRFKARGGDIVNRQKRVKLRGSSRQYVISEYMAVLP